MTQLDEARAGRITPAMRAVAEAEGVGAEHVRAMLAEGKLAIPCNVNRGEKAVYGIGGGLTVKVNANLGTSGDINDPALELEKLKAAEEAGAHAVMDLSTGGDLGAVRRMILDLSLIHI